METFDSDVMLSVGSLGLSVCNYVLITYRVLQSALFFDPKWVIKYSFIALIFETPSLSSKVFLQVSVLTTYNTEMHFFAFRCFKRERERGFLLLLLD